ncbi:unnamed protein product [Gongylonema pulchrum]|uniref:Uncharacterized protein n=1 Tax=Gongylonema pulchrum TaxID=637853 RepID=A0A183DV62_9BILA|nr:unnamed protein product [Gongylonema pulchrum]
MASFMKYPRRIRLRSDSNVSTMRHMLHVGISGGSSRFTGVSGFSLIDINVISRSFLRSQRPNPDNFHHLGMVTAPPQGLILKDVVYDERMFVNPIPFHHHSWDEETDVDDLDES